MSRPVSFLDLPFEIRLQVYAESVTFEGGCIFDSESGKLCTADAEGALEPINLSLSLTCPQVAAEVAATALANNIITFRTAYSEDLRIGAARFHQHRVFLYLQAQKMLQTYSSSDEGDPRVPIFTEKIMDQVSEKYPQVEPILRGILTGNPLPSDDLERYGIVPSYLRRAIMYTIELSVQSGSLDRACYRFPAHAPEKLLALDKEFPPWHTYPTEQEFERLSDSKTPQWKLTAEYWQQPHVDAARNRQYTQGKYRFSAAAIAIGYLSRLPQHLRMHFRNIHLDEDKVGVAYPECHAPGLIKFCQENSRLRIQRRVDLWQNLFQTPYDRNQRCENAPEAMLLRNAEHVREYLSTVGILNSVALWVVEAVSLVPAGMPAGSFNLVLDGGGSPYTTDFLFRVHIHQAAIIQEMWEQAVSKMVDKPDYFKQRLRTVYIFEDFPQAIRDLVKRQSNIIQPNFEPQSLWWDPDTMVPKYPECEIDSFSQLYGEPEGWISSEEEETLPTWPELVAENILAEFSDKDEPRHVCFYGDIQSCLEEDWADHLTAHGLSHLLGEDFES